MKKNLISYFLLPSILFFLYQSLLFEELYESTSKVIVRQPDSSTMMDTSMALLTGLGVSSTDNDAQVLIEYIESIDMMNKINERLDLFSHYNSSVGSLLSRRYILKQDDYDQLYNVYLKMININVQPSSKVVFLKVKAYNSEFATRFNNEIIKNAEIFINDINNTLAKKQLNFYLKEHKKIEAELVDIKSDLLMFQDKHQILDPTSDSIALQTVTYTLESQVIQKQVELEILKSTLAPSSFLIKSKNLELSILKSKIKNERENLTRSSNNGFNSLINEYADIKFKAELLYKRFTSSLISQEKARIETYSQLKTLVTVDSPSSPRFAKYPEIIYNVLLFIIVNLMLFFIVRIIYLVIKELR